VRALNQFTTAFLLCLAGSTLACGDEVTPPSTTGTLEITTTTTGVEPDPDGYTVQVDAGATQSIGSSATLQNPDLPPGSHTVQLGGLAANCTVAQNPRTVSVAAGETSTVSFAVTCSASTGAVQITSATTGPAPDEDGYIVTVDGTEHGALGPSGAVSLEGLSPGHHLIGLTGLAANCQVAGGNPQDVTVNAGESITISFSVNCAAPPPNAGSLRIVTATSGPDRDRNGYTFTVDSGAAQTIGVNTTTTLANVSGGSHAVLLSGVAGNCSVQGTNPRTVTVSAGAVTEVSFAISCTATTGTARVSVTTSGSPPDADGYVAKLDDKDPGLPLSDTAPITFSRTPPGLHTLELTGIASNCTVAEGASRQITVEEGKTVEVTFAVSCASVTGALRVTTATSGVSPDPNGYLVLLDGAERGAIDGSAETTLDGIAAGAHTVGLTGLTPNCTVEGENPQPATVSAGATVTVSFTVACQVATGLVWTPMVADGTYDLHDVWGNGPADVFAVGGQQILHYDGARWSEELRLESTPGSDTWGLPGGLRGVWSSSATDVFVVGGNLPGGIEPNYGVVFHHDGSGWSEMTRFALDGTEFTTLNAVWGASPTDVFAVGAHEFLRSSRPLIAHYDGTSWSAMGLPENAGDLGLYDVWGTSGQDVYAVGTRGLNGQSGYTGVVLHYDGTAWSTVAESGQEAMVAVWGSAANDVVVATAFGGFLHFDGATWAPMAAPVRARENIWGLWGSAPNDMYAVGGAYSFADGRKGAIHHFEGSTWLEQTGGTSAPLYSAWGSSPTDVFAVGGTILHGTIQPPAAVATAAAGRGAR
jgi:predicted RNA-binding protein with TRAM domain